MVAVSASSMAGTSTATRSVCRRRASRGSPTTFLKTKSSLPRSWPASASHWNPKRRFVPPAAAVLGARVSSEWKLGARRINRPRASRRLRVRSAGAAESPLEELLSRDGPSFISCVEARATESDNFRRALGMLKRWGWPTTFGSELETPQGLDVRHGGRTPRAQWRWRTALAGGQRLGSRARAGRSPSTAAVLRRCAVGAALALFLEKSLIFSVPASGRSRVISRPAYESF